MKKPHFTEMTPEQFKALYPRNEEECEAYEAERIYRDSCKANGEDYRDANVREDYLETQRASSQPMDENDQEGWEHNFLKALEERD